MDGAPLPVEKDFVLADGYEDPRGEVHRTGRMRCARAVDELRALGDFRAYLRQEAFPSVVLARVIASLGGLPRIDAGVVERLSRQDRDALEALYRELNEY